MHFHFLTARTVKEGHFLQNSVHTYYVRFVICFNYVKQNELAFSADARIHLFSNTDNSQYGINDYNKAYQYPT